MKLNRTIFIIFTMACLSVSFNGAAFADTITTNDGKEIKGIVIEDYKDRILFSTPDGEITIMKSEMRELSYDSDDENLVKLAEQAIDRRNYSRAMTYYEMALKANPEFVSAKQGIIFLQGMIFRKEESAKIANIKRQEEAELYGGVGARRTESDEIEDMARTLTRSTGMKIAIKNNMPEIESVKPGSPAFEAGVRTGDILVSVWDRLTGYLSLKETLDLLLNRSAIEIRCTIERVTDVPINPKKTIISGIEDLIGASFIMELDGLTISDLKENAPGIEAGLQKGDLIMAIDGKSTRYMQLKKAIELIKNSNSGSVKLTIRRKATIWRSKEI